MGTGPEDPATAGPIFELHVATLRLHYGQTLSILGYVLNTQRLKTAQQGGKETETDITTCYGSTSDITQIHLPPIQHSQGA